MTVVKAQSTAFHPAGLLSQGVRSRPPTELTLLDDAGSITNETRVSPSPSRQPLTESIHWREKAKQPALVIPNTMSHIGALSPLNRYITGHRSDGKSIFTTTIPSALVQYGTSAADPTQKASGAAISPTANSTSSIAYTTRTGGGDGPTTAAAATAPVSLAADADVAAYQAHLAQNASLPLPFVFTNGTTTHYSELGPGLVTPMHQTVSIDQIVLLSGALQLLLDSGESRVLQPGDMVVQRGTMHAWRNPSETEWARFFAVVQPIEPVVVNGKELGLEFHAVPDV